MNITSIDQVQVTEAGDPATPMVVLLHGNGGTILDMTDPGSPSMGDRMYNYNIDAPLKPFRDLGWSWYPHVGPYSFELSPWKSVRSWRQIRYENGYRTAAYSQIDNTGYLVGPVQELTSIMSKLVALYPGTRFVLLAHSRGGLLVRKFLKDNAGTSNFEGSWG